MKATLLFFVMILISITTQAQDRIIKKDGTELQVKVEEVQENVVKYRRLNNLTGPMYNVKKIDIEKIIYEKGSIESFVNGSLVTEEAKPTVVSPRSITETQNEPVVEKKVVSVVEEPKQVVEVVKETKPQVEVIEEKKVISVVAEEPKKVVEVVKSQVAIIEEKKVMPVVAEEPKKLVEVVKPQVVAVEDKKVSPVAEPIKSTEEVGEVKSILNTNREHRVESDIIPADVMERKSAANAIAKVIGIVMADKEGNEPIEGAIIKLEDGQITKTNKNGVFNLLLVMGSEVEISHNDFDTQKLKVENAAVSVVLNKALTTFDMSLLKDVRIPQSKAQPIQIAYYYFINSQFKESARVFEKYSEALSSDDLYTWGDCYWKMGKFKEAVNDHWTKAAIRGNQDAIYQLGVYEAEIKKDNEKAIIHLKDVAQNNKNYGDAQLLLGLAYSNDNVLKIKYLTIAATIGNSEAMWQLGEHFRTTNDLKMANEWYRNACVLKNRKACGMLKEEF